jgi:hypothetical protein
MRKVSLPIPGQYSKQMKHYIADSYTEWARIYCIIKALRQRLPRRWPEGNRKGGDRTTRSWPCHCELMVSLIPWLALQPPPLPQKNLLPNSRGTVDHRVGLVVYKKINFLSLPGFEPKIQDHPAWNPLTIMFRYVTTWLHSDAGWQSWCIKTANVTTFLIF